MIVGGQGGQVWCMVKIKKSYFLMIVGGQGGQVWCMVKI